MAYIILTPVAISDCSGSSTPVRYNTHACIFSYTFSWCSIHIPFFDHHSHCVRISSVTSCNTGQLVTDSLALSYLLLILSLAIRHSCIKVALKCAKRKPCRHDAHYTHLSNPVLISVEPQAYIGLTINCYDLVKFCVISFVFIPLICIFARAKNIKKLWVA